MPPRYLRKAFDISAIHSLGLVLSLSLVFTPTLLSAQGDGDSPAPQRQEAPLTTAGTEEETDPSEEFSDEMAVTASYSFDRSAPTVGTTLDQQRIIELPHFGDDPYRAFRVLPGVTAGELSASFGVRGTPYEDVYARLDGVELFAPFHLLDFEGVFSVLDAENLDSIDFIPSTYTSEFGDRSGGVLDMTSSTPHGNHYRLGLSISNVSVAASGALTDRFNWFVSGRRGYIDQLISAADAVDPDGDDADDDDGGSSIEPKYWDSFARGDFQLSDRQWFTIGTLLSDDDLDFGDEEVDGFTDVTTGYGNKNYWFTHGAVLGSRAHVSTNVSRTTTTRDRDIAASDRDESFQLADDREMTATNVRQEWTMSIRPSQTTSLGFEGRRFEATIDYANTIGFSDLIRDPRFVQNRTEFTNLDVKANYDYFSAWASERIRFGNRLTVEAGLRFDQQFRELALGANPFVEAPTDDQVSPRINAVFDLGSGGQLRAGWGHFYQSQRPNELEVEFGSTELYDAEKQEQFTLGWNKRLSKRLSLRADAYWRHAEDPRPRHETLFSQNSAFGELREDIYFVQADSFEATGVELFLEGRGGEKFEWSAAYSYSKTEEAFTGSDGKFTRPRYNDQPHAGNLNMVWRPSKKWALNTVWYYHTGWPTTQVNATARLEPGQVVADLSLSDLDFEIGPFYGERLPAYHRLDLRLTRTFTTKRGGVSLYLDIQDLYDRDNIAGLEIGEAEFTALGNDRLQVTFFPEEQLGLLPSFGVTWKF
ncbi:MAG: hypothetical protein K0U98_18370 [Deltaproteobacteria bacterium]|nr:hypothetical protein [Deltaproteobacteria bacterium]